MGCGKQKRINLICLMDPSEALTYQEISDLNNRKLEIKRQHSEYVENHPEIKEM